MDNPVDPYYRIYGGDELYQVYQLMLAEVTGWWYANGVFTFEMFIGLLIAQEASFGAIEFDSIAGAMIARITAQNMYVGGDRPATCPGGVGANCFGGAFNFWAAFSQVAQGWINTYVRGDTPITKFRGVGRVGDYGINSPEVKAYMDQAAIWGHDAMYPSFLSPKDAGPSDYGNVAASGELDPLRVSVPEGKINGPSSTSVWLYFDNVVYYSKDQEKYWQSRGVTFP